MSAPPESGTRVWVKQSAIDAVRNPRPSFKEKMSRKPSTVSTGIGSLNSHFSRQCSFNSAAGGSVASFSSNRDIDNESDVGSVGFSVHQPNRNEKGWGWKSGYLNEASKGSLTISLDAVTPETSTAPFSLPPSAMSDGDVVMANDYPVSSNGTPICPHDLITLNHLHEPAVVECLNQRYDDDQIYTATGPVLLALNPFQSVRGLYGESTMKKYWEKAEKNAKGSLPPHVYAIADSAFRGMMRKLDETLGEVTPIGCDQSILVSGESGAGKTVTTKFVMKYLAALSQRAGNLPPEKRAFQMVAEKRQFTPSTSWNAKEEVQDNDRGLSSVTALTGAGATNSIEAQVLQSNPILESFGNARTVRNDNSSRFGKFIEIQFTRMGRLVGAQIDVYLLEKVRLVTQSLGERNYHIFYELLSGAMGAQELRNFFLASTATPEDFKMTASGTYDRRDGVSDKETYRALKAAMNSMKFPQEEQKDVFATAAAILHASNLSFVPVDQGSALDDRNVHLQPVCHLFGVSAEDLSRALCSFSITAGKSTHVLRSLTVEGAVKGLEALLKTTYGALFTYLVSRINDSISFRRDYESDEEDSVPDTTMDPVACIGVLDIFGFESFTTNSFEQLCINYCNEALQQQFNDFILKNEQAEYDREGIEWSFIDFPENQDVLDLIDKRGSGILSILDDQCRAPGTSDKSFALDVYNKCKGQSRFSASRKQTATLQFSVNHYAGPVEYTTTGFIEKNRDELPKEATELLQNSYNPFIRILADIIENTSVERAASAMDTPHKARRQESAMGRTTVGGQFRRQLRHLRDKIDKMSPNYIRCLKPNDELVPDHFDRAPVAEQLRCGGILEAVRVARAGFSNHYPHSEFVRRYRCLGWRELTIKETGATYNGGGFGGVPQSKRKGPRPPGAFGSHNSRTQNTAPGSRSSDSETNSKELVKILYRRLQQEKDDNNENENAQNSSNNISTPVAPSTPPALAKKYSYYASTPPPTWSKGSKAGSSGLPPAPMTAPVKVMRSSATWDKRASDSRPPSSPAMPPRGGKRRGCGTTADWAKAGIQIGKTKVFLRHTAFEALERLRSQEQSAAAIKLNAIFRMYLARLAYVHVRDSVRHSMHHLQLFESEYKETKEQEYGDNKEENYFLKLRNSCSSSSYQGEAPSLVEVWANQVRSGLHNPVPRNQWGKETSAKPFKWMLTEGLWIKNHDFEE
jgi:myosin-5